MQNRADSSTNIERQPLLNPANPNTDYQGVVIEMPEEDDTDIITASASTPDTQATTPTTPTDTLSNVRGLHQYAAIIEQAIKRFEREQRWKAVTGAGFALAFAGAGAAVAWFTSSLVEQRNVVLGNRGSTLLVNDASDNECQLPTDVADYLRTNYNSDRMVLKPGETYCSASHRFTEIIPTCYDTTVYTHGCDTRLPIYQNLTDICKTGVHSFCEQLINQFGNVRAGFSGAGAGILFGASLGITGINIYRRLTSDRRKCYLFSHDEYKKIIMIEKELGLAYLQNSSWSNYISIAQCKEALNLIQHKIGELYEKDKLFFQTSISQTLSMWQPYAPVQTPKQATPQPSLLINEENDTAEASATFPEVMSQMYFPSFWFSAKTAGKMLLTCKAAGDVLKKKSPSSK